MNATLATWIHLLGGARLLARGGDPTLVGGGTRTLQEIALGRTWLRAEGIPSRRELRSRLRQVQPSASSDREQLGWCVAETIFLAGLRWRVYGTQLSDFYRSAVPAALVARRSYESWTDFFAHCRAGAAGHLAPTHLERLDRAMQQLTGRGGKCRELPWQAFVERAPPVTAVACVLHRRCTECRRWMPVQRLASEITCPHCLAKTASDSAAEALLGLRHDLRYHLPGMGACTFERQTATTLEVLYCRPEHPSCRHCAARLDLSALPYHPAQENLSCAHCGTPHGLRQLATEEQSALDGIEWILGERHQETASALPGLQTAMSCAHCGQALVPDPNRRKSTCSHCHGKTPVPDAIWSLLHPPEALCTLYALARSPST